MDMAARLRSFRVLGQQAGNIYEQMAEKGYAITFLIGKGGFGAVYAGIKQQNGKLVPVAMKLIGG